MLNREQLAKAAAEAMAAWEGRAAIERFDEEIAEMEDVIADREVDDPLPKGDGSDPDRPDDNCEANPRCSLAEYAAAKTQNVEDDMIAWLDGDGARPDVMSTPPGDKDPLDYADKQIIRKHLGKDARWFLWYRENHTLRGPHDRPATDAQRDRYRRLKSKLWKCLIPKQVTPEITHENDKGSAWKPTMGHSHLRKVIPKISETYLE